MFPSKYLFHFSCNTAENMTLMKTVDISEYGRFSNSKVYPSIIVKKPVWYRHFSGSTQGCTLQGYAKKAKRLCVPILFKSRCQPKVLLELVLKYTGTTSCSCTLRENVFVKHRRDFFIQYDIFRRRHWENSVAIINAALLLFCRHAKRRRSCYYFYLLHSYNKDK